MLDNKVGKVSASSALVQVEQLESALRSLRVALRRVGDLDAPEDIEDAVADARNDFDTAAIDWRRLHEHVVALCVSTGLDVGC